MVGMVEWQECRTEWSNGRNGYIRTIYADGMVKMVGMVKWWEWRMEWSNGGNGGRNGRMAEIATYVLFMVHTDTDTDDNDNNNNDDDDTLIFYSIDKEIRCHQPSSPEVLPIHPNVGS